MNRPHTLADCQRLASSRGGRCLSTRYKNKDAHLTWQCAAGHRWRAHRYQGTVLPRVIYRAGQRYVRAAAPEDFDPYELALGLRMELEHVTDSAVAQQTAMDHLTGDPQYYSKLQQLAHRE